MTSGVCIRTGKAYNRPIMARKTFSKSSKQRGGKKPDPATPSLPATKPAKAPKTLCAKCSAMCCRYIALPFDEPTDRESFDEARWFLMHEGVTVFVSDDQWYVSVATPCKHLDEQGMCSVYPKRPQICRDYADENCDYCGGDYEYSLFFCHPEQMEAYANEVLGENEDKPKRKPRKKGRK